MATEEPKGEPSKPKKRIELTSAQWSVVRVFELLSQADMSGADASPVPKERDPNAPPEPLTYTQRKIAEMKLKEKMRQETQ